MDAENVVDLQGDDFIYICTLVQLLDNTFPDRMSDSRKIVTI